MNQRQQRQQYKKQNKRQAGGLNRMQQWLLVFDSTHHAIAAENRIKRAAPENVTFQMIPTPRQITASCGLSLLFAGEIQPRQILGILEDHDVQWAGLYQRESEHPTPWTNVEEEP